MLQVAGVVLNGGFVGSRICQGVIAPRSGGCEPLSFSDSAWQLQPNATRRSSWTPFITRLLGLSGGVLLTQQSAVRRRRHPAKRRAAARPWLGAEAVSEASSSWCTRGTGKEEDSIETLISWLKGHGARGLDGLRIARSAVPEKGLAVYATRDFEPEEEFCFVPASAILCGEEPGALTIASDMDVPDKVRKALAHDYVRLAAALLREHHLGPASRFAPYMALVPEWPDLAPMHPIHWTEIDNISYDQLLDGSSNGRQLAQASLEEIDMHVQALVASGVAKDEMEAKWAILIVNTRCFSSRSGAALIPLLDMLNAFFASEALDDEDYDEDEDDVPETEWHVAFDSLDALDGSAGTGGRMLVERHTKAGEEVLYLYSTHCTAHLWMSYGFVPTSGENPFEAAAVTVDLLQPASILVEDHDEAFLEVACTALAEAGVPLHGSHGRRLHFNLPEDTEAGGILLPVARVLACRDAQKVPEIAARLPSAEKNPDEDMAVEKQGAFDLGIQLELEARTLVLHWLQTELQQSRAAAKRLESFIRADRRGEVPAAAKKELRLMARRLLECEQPVLEFEAEVQEEFCEEVQRLGLRPWAPPLESIDREALAKLEDALMELESDRWEDDP